MHELYFQLYDKSEDIYQNELTGGSIPSVLVITKCCKQRSEVNLLKSRIRCRPKKTAVQPKHRHDHS